MIIWLASYPRSGNTFVRMLLNHHYGYPTYSLYNESHPPAGYESLGDAMGKAELHEPMDELKRSKKIFFVKTHDFPADDSPAIYLIRDGRDALVSYAHFILAFIHTSQPQTQADYDATFKQILQNLITTNESFGGWGPNVAAWTQRPAHTVILKYEGLAISNQPITEINQALNALGVHPEIINTEPISPFNQLHDKMPKFFRKGQIGAGKMEMSSDLQALFWEKHGEIMQRNGYMR